MRLFGEGYLTDVQLAAVLLAAAFTGAAMAMAVVLYWLA